MSALKKPAKGLAEKLAAADRRIGKLKTELTRHRAKEAELRAGVERFRAIVEESNAIVFTLSLDGAFTSLSPAWVRSMGYSYRDVEGQPMAAFLHPDDIEECRRRIRKVMSEGHSHQHLDYRVRHADGSWRWHSSSGAPLRDEKGNACGFIGIARDITDLKSSREQLEQKLREARVRYQVSQALAGKNTEEEVLDALIATAGITPEAQISLYVWDEEDGIPVLVKRREGLFKSGIVPAVPIGSRMKATTYPSIMQYKEGAVFFSNDLAHDESIDEGSRDLLRRQEAQSYAAVQITDGSDRYGIIFVVAKTVDYFQDDKLLLYQTMAAQGAIALRTARLWETVRASQERLSLVVRQSPLAIVEWDTSFTVISWNPAAERIFGYTAREAIGRNGIGLLLDEEERPRIRERMKEFETRKETFDITRPTRTKDKGVLICEWFSAPRYNGQGNLVGAVSIIEDVTEKNRVARELRESEDRYRRLSEASREGVAIHAQGTLLDVNQVFAQMFGYTEKEVPGMHVTDFVAPEFHETLMHNVQGGSAASYEVIGRRRDGSPFPMSVLGVPTTYKGQSARVATLRDLTEEKRSQALLESTLRETQVHYEVSRALAGKESEEEVLDAIIANAGLYPKVHISLYTEETGVPITFIKRRQANYDSGIRPLFPMGARIGETEYPVFVRAYAEGAYFSNNVESDATLDQGSRANLLKVGAGSIAVIPLKEGGERFGLLFASMRSPGKFDEEILHLYTTLAEQGAAALRAARLRETIRASQRRLSLLVSQSPLGIIEWDTDFRVVSWNPAAERIFGYSQEQAKGRAPWGLVLPETTMAPPHPLHAEEMRQTVNGAQGNITRAGRAVSCLWYSSPLIGGDGAFLGLVSIVEDLTEQRRIEEEARASEKNFRRIAENMRDMISEVDAEGIYRYVSPSYRRVLGYEPEKLIGTHFYEYIHPDDRERIVAAFDEGARRGGEGELEYRFRHADGRYLWFSTLSRYLLDRAGRFVGAMRSARETTERKRADDEVRRLNEQLEERVAERTAQLEAANRELEAFSYSVSHDLRAPLRAINGFSRIVQDDWSAVLPEEVQSHLRTIRENTTQMGLLIEGLLSLSRLNRQQLRMKPIVTAEMVREVINSLAEQTAGRQIEFLVGDVPDHEGDPVLLRQVWINLISNAVKFTRRRKEARIEIGAVEQNGQTAFFVRDNGVGFDMRYADKLFGVFQRLHASAEYEGTGIGLANVQRIVRRHGGRVWAEAVPDVGATFYFSL